MLLATILLFSLQKKHPVTTVGSIFYSSFELNLVKLDLSQPVMCTVIQQPPKYNKDFINDFSDFLAGILQKHDTVLFIKDFNIHACCPTKPLVKDFLNLIDSFNLVQSDRSYTRAWAR